MRKTSTGKMKRSFTIVDVRRVDGCQTKFANKDYTGVYLGSTPAQAAMKTLRRLCDVKRIKGACTLVVTIRETTQESKHKEFTYKIRREKRDDPVVLENRTPFEYNTIIKSTKPSSLPKCKKSHKTSGRKSSKSRRTMKKKN